MSYLSEQTKAGLEPPYRAEYDDPAVLYPGEVRALLDGARWNRFVVIGDSLAEGLGQPTAGYRDLPWADRVADALRHTNPDLEYVNLGKRYLTAREVEREQLGPALAAQPDLAFVVAGGNDLFEPGFDAKLTAAKLEQMFMALRGSGATVVGTTLMDVTRAVEMPYGETLSRNIRALNAELRVTALRSAVALVDMERHPVASDPGIYSDDHLHANMRGHAVLASATIERLAELVRFAEGEL